MSGDRGGLVSLVIVLLCWRPQVAPGWSASERADLNLGARRRMAEQRGGAGAAGEQLIPGDVPVGGSPPGASGCERRLPGWHLERAIAHDRLNATVAGLYPHPGAGRRRRLRPGGLQVAIAVDVRHDPLRWWRYRLVGEPGAQRGVVATGERSDQLREHVTGAKLGARLRHSHLMQR